MKKPDSPLEWKEQVALFQWLRGHPVLKYYATAIENEGKRSIKSGALAKSMGKRKGVSDILIAYPCNGYHGLWIELKRLRPKGRVSPEQQEWIDLMNGVGYMAVVAYGASDAINQITAYLSPNTR